MWVLTHSRPFPEVGCRAAKGATVKLREGQACLQRAASFPVPFSMGKVEMAVGQNQWQHFGVGEFTTHVRTYFSGDWDVHWGYGILPLGQMRLEDVACPILCVLWFVCICLYTVSGQVCCSKQLETKQLVSPVAPSAFVLIPLRVMQAPFVQEISAGIKGLLMCNPVRLALVPKARRF